MNNFRLVISSLRQKLPHNLNSSRSQRSVNKWLRKCHAAATRHYGGYTCSYSYTIYSEFVGWGGVGVEWCPTQINWFCICRNHQPSEKCSTFGHLQNEKSCQYLHFHPTYIPREISSGASGEKLVYLRIFMSICWPRTNKKPSARRPSIIIIIVFCSGSLSIDRRTSILVGSKEIENRQPQHKLAGGGRKT